MHDLYTIAFSHYCERGRWALERYGIPYREHRYLPVFHVPAVRWASRGSESSRSDEVSTTLSTPLLVTSTGERVHDSGDILRWAHESVGAGVEDLYPSDEVRVVEQRLHDKLGPHTRRVAYYFCFERPAVLLALAEHNVGRGQYLLFRATIPVVRGFLRRALRISRQGYERSVERTRREAEWVSSLLADGRRFLMGDHFTAADLTLACMLAPAVLPTEEVGYGAWLPREGDLQQDAAAFVREIRATPAGRLAARLFEEERRRVIVRM